MRVPLIAGIRFGHRHADPRSLERTKQPSGDRPYGRHAGPRRSRRRHAAGDRGAKSRHRGLSVLIARYTRPEIGRIWSDRNKFQQWLEVELAASDALAELGVV